MAPRQSSNDPCYREAKVPVQSLHRRRHETVIQRISSESTGVFQGTVKHVWAGLKGFGRSIVRWLVWQVFLPLSIIASLWVPVGNPANLGL